MKRFEALTGLPSSKSTARTKLLFAAEIVAVQYLPVRPTPFGPKPVGPKIGSMHAAPLPHPGTVVSTMVCSSAIVGSRQSQWPAKPSA